MAEPAKRKRRSHARDDIRHKLLRRIGRRWKPGERLPAIRDLTDELGGCYVSVQRAVKSLAEEGILMTRDRVGVFVTDQLDDFELLTETDQRPPQAAKHPLTGLRVNAMVQELPANPFIGRMVNAFLSQMRVYRCDVSRVALQERTDGKYDLTGLACEAVAVIGITAPEIFKVAEGVTCVLVNHAGLPVHQIEPVTEMDVVGTDHTQGGMIAGRYLRDAGVERVCFLGRLFKNHKDRDAPRPNHFDDSSLAKMYGFEEGFGQQVSPRHKLRATWYSPDAAAKLVPKYLAMDPRPDGVFAATDELAVGFIHGAQSHGLVPGRDYQIIGFDGQQIGRERSEGALTTVDIPLEEMGRRAADLLAERMLDPRLPHRQTQFGCRLFPGKTVRMRRRRRSR